MSHADSGPSFPSRSGQTYMHENRLPAVKIDTLMVHPLTMDQTIDELEHLISTPGVSQHVVVNAAKVVAAHADPELRHVIEACDVINADGMSIVWASRLLGTPLPERVTGIDAMFELLKRGEERGWSIYLLGARPEVIPTVVSRVHAQYPHVNIVGHRHGYWSPSEEKGVVADIRESGADLLFVALPTPAKELFVGRNRQELGVRLVVGVGGSFDIIAGRTTRAPLWMQKAGMEWAYRVAQEPGRMWRRYLIGNTQYINLIGRQWARSKSRGKSQPA